MVDPVVIIGILEHDERRGFFIESCRKPVKRVFKLCVAIFYGPDLLGAVGGGADDRFDVEHIAEKGAGLRQPSAGRQIFELIQEDILFTLFNGSMRKIYTASGSLV